MKGRGNERVGAGLGSFDGANWANQAQSKAKPKTQISVAPNISMFILKKVGNDILNTMAGSRVQIRPFVKSKFSGF